MPIKSTMSLSRSVMNFIVENRFPGTKSLYCVDLLSQLFENIPPPPSEDQELATHTSASDPGIQNVKQAEKAALRMERMQLSRPIFTFQSPASDLNEQPEVDCFPLADGKMLWADQFGHSFIFHVGRNGFEPMPCLHKPKNKPFSLFMPCPDEDSICGPGSRIFLMERFPKPEAICSKRLSRQFEAFVCHHDSKRVYNTWLCQLLPPPPFFHEPEYWHIRPGISSYAVVGGGKDICISVNGFGSYCLDTENYTWSDLGKWNLPFHGKVEYVPELKLWFGLSIRDHLLAAADLSAMDSEPQLMRTWKQVGVQEEWKDYMHELKLSFGLSAKDHQFAAADLFAMKSHPQLMRTWKQLGVGEGWKEYKDPQLVNLGNGRFCIVRFFQARTLNGENGNYSGQFFAVFTGVEVLPPVCSSKEVELQMIPRKSICHISKGTSIDTVF